MAAAVLLWVCLLDAQEDQVIRLLSRIYSAVKSSRSFPFLLPVGAALIIPGLLIFFLGICFRNLYIQLLIGSLLIVCGLFLIIWTVSLFRRIGHGTLAPWSPTRQLVIAGPYAYTRNPMISGVLFVLLGEGILAGSLAILVWAVIFFSINTLYFKLSEEPGLLKRFGDEYIAYRSNVPMWLPRLKPWRG
jgi:protein-S-isoprenylcysteine O-methyltransferase Ste14